MAGAKWHSDERPNAAAVKKLADCAEKAIAKKVAAETAEKAARVVEEVAANADVSDVSDEEDSMPLDLRQKLRGVAPEGGGTKRRRAPAAAAKRAFFIGTQRVELFMAKDLVGLGKETARKFVYLPEASAAVVQGDRVSLPDGAITTTMKIPRNDRKAIFIGTQRVELFTAEELVGLREETAKFVFMYVPTELGVQEPFKAGETSELEKLCCRTLRDMNRQSRAERRLPAAPVVEEPDGVTGLSHAQMEQLGCPSVVNGSTAGQCAIYAFSRLLSQRSCGPTECAEQVAALKAEAAQQPRKWITTAAFESGDAAFSQAEINYASQEGAQVQLGMLHLALAKAGISCLLLVVGNRQASGRVHLLSFGALHTLVSNLMLVYNIADTHLSILTGDAGSTSSTSLADLAVSCFGPAGHEMLEGAQSPFWRYRAGGDDGVQGVPVEFGVHHYADAPYVRVDGTIAPDGTPYGPAVAIFRGSGPQAPQIAVAANWNHDGLPSGLCHIIHSPSVASGRHLAMSLETEVPSAADYNSHPGRVAPGYLWPTEAAKRSLQV